MKFAAIFLMTMNLWGSLFCCCQDSGCSQEEQLSCGSQEVSEVGPQPSTSSCHGMSQTPSSTTESELQEEQNHRGVSSKETVDGMCLCGNHSAPDISISLPSGENTQITVSIALDIAAWLTDKSSGTQESEVLRREAHVSVALNRPPSLSALSRFII